MAAEERHGAVSLPKQAPSAASKTEVYRYSASSYTTKSNEGMCVREEEKKKKTWPVAEWQGVVNRLCLHVVNALVTCVFHNRSRVSVME